VVGRPGCNQRLAQPTCTMTQLSNQQQQKQLQRNKPAGLDRRHEVVVKGRSAAMCELLGRDEMHGHVQRRAMGNGREGFVVARLVLCCACACTCIMWHAHVCGLRCGPFNPKRAAHDSFHDKSTARCLRSCGSARLCAVSGLRCAAHHMQVWWHATASRRTRSQASSGMPASYHMLWAHARLRHSASQSFRGVKSCTTVRACAGTVDKKSEQLWLVHDASNVIQ
jgi:hypothetical protein